MVEPVSGEAGPGDGLPGDLFGGRRVFFQAFFGGYALGLDRVCPIEAVACMDDGADFDLPGGIGRHQVCSVEAGSGRRRNWIGVPIGAIADARVAAMAAVLSRDPASWLVTSQPTCDRLQALCRELGCRYVGTDARVAAGLAHKARLFECLEALQLPRVPGRWLGRARPAWSEVSAEWGRDLVIQRPEGYAGIGTARARDAHGWAAALARLGDGELWVAPHLGALSLNINAAVVGGVAVAGFPSVQVTGLAELGAGWGGYGGNDFSAATALDRELVEDVQEQTARVAGWMGALGFEGLCGLDFVVDPASGRAVAVDLNPRWQGSTALATQAELADGRLPLAAAGLAAQAGLLDASELGARADVFRAPLRGSQLNLRAVLAAPTATVRGARPGARPSGSRSGDVAVRPASCLDELRDDEHLLTGGVPRPGVIVEPGAWIGRIVSRRAALEPDGLRLRPWARAALDDYLSELGLPVAPVAPT